MTAECLDISSRTLLRRINMLREEFIEANKKKLPNNGDGDDNFLDKQIKTEIDNEDLNTDDFNGGIRNLENWGLRFNLPPEAIVELLTIISEDFHGDAVLAFEYLKKDPDKCVTKANTITQLANELKSINTQLKLNKEKLKAVKRKLEINSIPKDDINLKILNIVTDIQKIVTNGYYDKQITDDGKKPRKV